MLKKNQLGEKLKKLKVDGASAKRATKKTSPEPSDKAPKVITEPKVIQEKPIVKGSPPKRKALKAPETIKPIQKKVEEQSVPAVEEPILQVKKASKIKEKKPEELIEDLIEEKSELTFINELAIPAQKLAKLFSIETSYTEDTLNQILTAWKDPEKIIKWTVKNDKHGQEFYSLKGEGLMKMKDNPPIYGMEFDDGALISTHMGDYTFIMGCYNFDVKSLVKIFAYGVENAKRFNL